MADEFDVDEGEFVLPKGDGYMFPHGGASCFINEQPTGRLDVVVFDPVTGHYRIHKSTYSQAEASNLVRLAFIRFNWPRDFSESLPGTIN